MAAATLSGSILDGSSLESHKFKSCGQVQVLRNGIRIRIGTVQISPSALRRLSVTRANVAAEGAVSSGVSLITFKAAVTIKRKPDSKLIDIVKKGLLDFFLTDPAGQDIKLQLVSTQVDPKTGCGKRSKELALEKVSTSENTVVYTGDVVVDKLFGAPGAILVSNKHKAEFFLETVTLERAGHAPVYFSCYSWVHSHNNDPSRRIFFYNEIHLPGSTPQGLRNIRNIELQSLRGNGKGVRKAWERVYDYDVYNDLGNPDKDKKLSRPAAGGDKVPYPRRCRTGRPPTKTDVLSESRLPIVEKNYVPRDEDFEQTKTEAFSSGRLRAILHRLVPTIITHFTATPDEFDSLTDIDRLFYEGIRLETGVVNEDDELWNAVPAPVKQLVSSNTGFFANAIKYPLPPLLEKDRYAWTRDSEFGRQMLAGLNPLTIQRLKVFPPKTAFEAAELEKHLQGLTVEEAIEADKVFMVDYHDIYMPLINQINSLKGRKTHATRTILYLDSKGLLRPVGIELSLPPSKLNPNGSSRAFYPSDHATRYWLWQLAKTHVRSNHSSYHQVVSHWLQTHACIEPYSIATNRQLSAMHPVAKLLHPHLRYTMQINAAARQTLINADGIIERCFTPGEYVLNISTAAYKTWRFDKQGLPADLLERGMAVEDKDAPHGLRLVIQDYPYAADGLLIWSALKSWVSSYLSIFYHSGDAVVKDTELEAWWNEIKTKGHPEAAKEGWPKLETVEDLTDILTSMIWVASGHHAAVNFGQFLYSGYVLNSPCMTRRLIPEEKDPEYKDLVQRPQEFLLSTLPNQVQATTVMAVLELLSTHHPDEEYLGQRVAKYWTSNRDVLQALKRFQDEISAVEKIIMERNKDPNLVHRHGAGIPPYELLLPFSAPGLSARGVPNSVSI